MHEPAQEPGQEAAQEAAQEAPHRKARRKPARTRPLADRGQPATDAAVVGHLDAAAAALDVALRAAPGDPALDAVCTHLQAARSALVGAARSRPTADDPPRLLASFDLVGDPSTAARAREFVHEVCLSWRLPPAVAGAATDIANELVANALQHGGRAGQITLELAPEHLTMRVFDESSAPPRQRAYVPGVSVRGLGLRLVDQLATTWGHVPWNGGKYVWALLHVGHPRERDPVPRGESR